MSVDQWCPTLYDPMNCSTPGLPVHHQLPESTQTHVHCVSDAIQPSHPVIHFSACPHPFPASGSFKWVSSLYEGAKLLEFQLQHQSSNEHPGGISFRMDWLDLFAVQETLKSLLQHFSSKASFFGAQIFFISKSHIHMWLLENHSFDRWTFIGKIMSLLFNMLSRLVIGFLPRSKCLLISWLQSPSAVIWRPPK